MNQGTEVKTFAGTEEDWNPNDLWVFAIFDHPTDLPHGYVVRPFKSRPEPTPSPLYAVAPTLAEARSLLPRGLGRLGRFPNDDPKLVECWI